MNSEYYRCNMSLIIIPDDKTINIDSVQKFFSTFNISPCPDSITILGYKRITIKKLVAPTNVLIICSSIIFEDNCYINLSCSKKRSDRKKNPAPDRMYGLPGFPGFPGHNLAVICVDAIVKNIDFISIGGKGGRGQHGTPNGKGGDGGAPGLLLINNKTVKTGTKGEHGDEDSDSINTVGFQQSEDNMFGLYVNTSEYKQIIHRGIHDNHISLLDSKFLSLFSM